MVRGRADLVKEVGTPDVTVLDVVKSLVATTDEVVNLDWVSDLVVLSPVASDLELGLLWGVEATEASQANHEWHVAAVASEEAQRLEVGLNNRAALHYTKR